MAGATLWPGYHPRWFKWQQAKALFKRASWLWLSGIVSVIYLKIDIVMIGSIAGTEQAGIYAAASRLSELWYVFPATLAARYYPDMIRAHQQGWTPYYLKLRRFAAIFFSAAFAIAVVMSITAPWIISLLFGDSFADAVDVLRIHIWAGCFIFVRYLISQHLLITEQEPLSLMSHAIGAALNVGLNLYLIPTMGIVGAAWATHVRVHTGVTVLVVSGFFLGVREHLVGLFGLLEFLFGGLGRITLVAVGVVLHRQLAIRLLDLVVAGVLGHAQHFVKIAFGHGDGSVVLLSRNAASGCPDAAMG